LLNADSPNNNKMHPSGEVGRCQMNIRLRRRMIFDVMLRGVDRTAEAVNTLPWLERWMLHVGVKSDFSDEKRNGLIKSPVFADAKA